MKPFDLIELAKKANTAEELVALARQGRIELSAEDAQIYFERWHGSCELSDDELDAVGGGTEQFAPNLVCEFCLRGDNLGIDLSGGGYYCYSCRRSCRGKRI